MIELNPLRLGYSLVSDRNPIMRAVAPLADHARANRVPASADNPFMTLQEQFSKAMVDALNLFRDLRDELVEDTFHVVYRLAPGPGRLRNLNMIIHPGRGLGCCPRSCCQPRRRSAV